MSFFRSIRSSITRGKSSSRDSTPVRATSTKSSSRPASVSSHNEARRDSLDSRADSAILNRGETFILNSDQEDQQRSNNSNSKSSTLEKKSKKSKVLSKFSTFTKRKKTPPQTNGSVGSVGSVHGNLGASFEHHPSDNATNTYYKWNTDGSAGAAVDYDAQSDPFNFLYEQHSNLKLLQNGIDTADGGGGVNGKQKQHGFFDSSTYRKGKASSQLKAQLEQLKTQQSSGSELHEEEQEPESEKYKTVTLNSFRKSFRDKFLQQQNEAPHNPAWFVEVEAAKPKLNNERPDSKENRPDYLIFENDNYRPGSRSPVRNERNASSEGRQSRSTTRSPVKRNETFRVERSTLDAADATAMTPTMTTITSQHGNSSGPSIRVEIKNSVLPRSTSGRIVPVGVAKPMPSMQPNNNNNSSYLRSHLPTTPVYSTTTNTPTSRKSSNSTSPQRSSLKTNSNSTPHLRAGKYQTLVQISNNNEANTMTKPTSTPAGFNKRNGRSNSTRIQLIGAAGTINNDAATNNKFNNNIGSRYSYAAPSTTSTLPASIALSAYELLREPQSNTKSTAQQQRLKQTYFGGDITATQQQQPTRFVMSPTATETATTIRTQASYGNNHNQQYGVHTNLANIDTNSKLRQHQTSHHSPKHSSSTTLGVGAINGYTNRRDLHQPRFTPVPVQRRSRSPIKMPWR